MKKSVSVFAIAFLMVQTAFARDWEARINELERMPRTEKVTEQIAICCNNLALELMEKHDWNNAERWMKKSLALHRDPVGEKNLGWIYLNQAHELYQRRSSKHVTGSMHQRAKLLAQRALAHHKGLTDAHLLIGEIEYENQKLRAARRAYRSAIRLDPQSRVARERLSRLERELRIEKKFSKTADSFFEVQYEHQNIDAELAEGIKLAMDTARAVVGKDYFYRTKHKIQVLVYSTTSFKKLKIAPHWAGGLYDGKIRLPLDDEENLRFAVATLFHEYTHAVIHDLSNGHCPHWLNEGLAELQGAKISPTSRKLVERGYHQGSLIPLDSLDDAFRSSDGKTVSLGYQQSASIASYLVESYGYRRIRRLLDELSNDVDFVIGLRTSLGISEEQLEARWREWLPRYLDKES